jgi:hypothetical protein
VATEASMKPTLRQLTMRELKAFAILTVYLCITLGAVILMKAAVLHAQGISFAQMGIVVVKAAVLAKLMLIGHSMKIGERNTAGPLIWPILHKALAFLALLVMLTILEDVIVGLFHHQSVAAALVELAGHQALRDYHRHFDHVAGIDPVLRHRRTGRGA